MKLNIQRTAMNTLKTFCSFAILLGLYGCGTKIPSCGDEEALSVLRASLVESIGKDSGGHEKEIKSNVKLVAVEPVIKSKDEKLPKFQCEAKIEYGLDDKRKENLKKVLDDDYINTFITLALLIEFNQATVGGAVEMYDNFMEVIKAQKSELFAPYLSIISKAYEIKVNSVEDFLNNEKLKSRRDSFNATATYTKNREDDARHKNFLKEMEDMNLVSKAVFEKGKFAFTVKYEINKIDGDKSKFKISHETSKNSINGMQNLEILYYTSARFELFKN